MLQGATYYLSQVLQGNPVSVSISATLKSGRYLEFGRGASRIYANTVFNNSVVVFGDITQEIKRITYDGSSIISSGTTISPVSSISDARFITDGNTLSLYYSVGRSSNSTIYRISSTNGDTWGGTQVIYGGSYIPSFSLAGNTRLYFIEGVSYNNNDFSQYSSVVNSLVNNGSTWVKYELYTKSFTSIRNDASYSMIPQIQAYSRNDNLDEIFVLGQWGASNFANPDEIRKLTSNGKVYFKEEQFFKPEYTAINYDQGNRINLRLTNVTDFVGSTTKVFGIQRVRLNNRFFGYASLSSDYGSFICYSDYPDSWGALQPVVLYTSQISNNPPQAFFLSSLSFGVSHIKYIGFENENGNSIYSLKIVEFGETQYDISSRIISYSNNDNENISLEVGNYE